MTRKDVICFHGTLPQITVQSVSLYSTCMFRLESVSKVDVWQIQQIC